MLDRHLRPAQLFTYSLREGLKAISCAAISRAQKAVDDGQIRQNWMRLAMSVDGHYRINEVVPRHFLQVAKAAGYGDTLAEDVLADAADRIELAIEQTVSGMPTNFPEDLVQTIADGVRQRTVSLMVRTGDRTE